MLKLACFLMLHSEEDFEDFYRINRVGEVRVAAKLGHPAVQFQDVGAGKIEPCLFMSP